MKQMDWANGMPLMVGDIQIGHAEPSPETVGYWDGIRDGKLKIKSCTECGRPHHPRRILCFHCGGDTFEWFEISGHANVFSFSTIHRAPSEEFQGELPYTVGIVELREGIHIFSRIASPEGREPEIGEAVQLEFRTAGDWGLMPAFVTE